MRRALPLIALLLAACGVAVFSWLRPSGPRAADRDGASQVEALDAAALDGVDGIDAVQSRPAATRAEVAASGSDGRTLPLASDSAEPVAEPFAGAFALEVVHAEDGAPAAGSTVWLADGGPSDVHDRLVQAQAEPVTTAPRPRALRVPTLAGERRWSHAADEHGRVYLSRHWPLLRVRGEVVRDGVLRTGAATLGGHRDPTSASEHRLKLHAASSVVVRVLDADGAPVAGCPVVVLASRGDAPAVLSEAETQGDGSARLVELAPAWREARRSGAALTVRAVGLFDPSVESTLDAAAVELELRLPPTGSVAVVPPHTGIRSLTLRVAGRPETAMFARTASGEVRFSLVGAGLSLEAELTSAFKKDVEAFEGPLAAGEHVVHRWAGLSAIRWFTAIVTDEQGAPLAHRAVEVDARLDSLGVTTLAAADASGRIGFDGFTMGSHAKISALGSQRVGNRSLVLTTRLEPEVLDAATIPERDLGTIRLASPELLASGRVVDTTGRPIHGAAVVVRTAGAPPGSVQQQATTDAAGTFVVTGALDAPLEAFAHASGLRGTPAGAIAPGAQDLEFVLRSEARLTLIVRLPAGLFAEAVRVAVEHGAGHAREMNVVPMPPAGPDDPIEVPYRALDLEPGPARVIVRASATGDVLAERHVELVIDTTTSLGVIDVSTLLSTVEIAVLDESAKHVRDAVVVVEDGELRSASSAPRPSPVRFARPRIGATIVASSYGRVPARAAYGGEERVELRPARARSVTLVLPSGHPLPAPRPHELTLVIERLDGDGRSASVSVRSDGRHPVHLDRPGQYVVTARAARVHGSELTVAAPFDVTEADLDATRSIELAFDLAEWTRLVEAVTPKGAPR